MSVHAKRAAVVVVLFFVFTVVHLAWPLLTAYASTSGSIGAVLFDPPEIAVEVLIVWVFTYWLSRLWSRRAKTGW